MWNLKFAASEHIAPLIPLLESAPASLRSFTLSLERHPSQSLYTTRDVSFFPITDVHTASLALSAAAVTHVTVPE